MPALGKITDWCDHFSFDLGLLFPREAGGFPDAFQPNYYLLRVAHAVVGLVRFPQLDGFPPKLREGAVHQ